MTEIPRIILDGSKDDRKPSAPGWISVESEYGNPLKPIIRCNCGELIGLALHHVHADGTVTASFYHCKEYDPNGCGWHVFLKLLDYDQGEFIPKLEK